MVRSEVASYIEEQVMPKQSNLDQYRSERDETSERRTLLLDAAQGLFLERGIASTTMLDIAERADVSRVTVYRYFAERDHVAIEVAGRMVRELAERASSAATPEMSLLEVSRASFLGFIAGYAETRDLHRYLAMFDNLAPLSEVTDEVDEWYRVQYTRAFMTAISGSSRGRRFDELTISRLLMLSNTIFGVLARLSIVAESPQDSASVEAQLEHLEDMVLQYFDHVVAPNAVISG